MDQITSLQQRLEQLYDIGASLSSERNLDALLDKILQAARTITHADGGTLYLLSPDARHLQFRIVRTDSLGIAFGGLSGKKVDGLFQDVPLYQEDGSQNLSMVAAYAALTGNTANIADAYEAQGFDFSGTRKFDAKTGYRSRSFLTVPMKNHEGDLIGVLQLINAVPEAGGEVQPFSDADQRLTESLASQAAIALSNRQLIEQLENLFEALIRMINQAIEDKSEHTGGHCMRVPALTMMLADAADEEQEGPLADFRLTEKDRYQLRIAAMLHDCGKLVTPVHVVDKASKLQTIFDRIELIETRAEIVRRDAENRCLRARLEGVPKAIAEAEQAAFSEQLAADCAFLKKANLGSERMSDQDIARVVDIGRRYRWSDAEGEHPFLLDDELENLCIRAGTLNARERDVINHHIEATISMLEALPWPHHLDHVPEYAAGHHERMDGKGYPKGLTGEQMSLPARMMAIADIFEALTAADRPYKKPMPLSEALAILEKFSRNGHIDPVLHELFVRRKVYLRYGQEFLLPQQRDL